MKVRTDGSWELRYRGELYCAGNKWNEDVALHVFNRADREGLLKDTPGILPRHGVTVPFGFPVDPARVLALARAL